MTAISLKHQENTAALQTVLSFLAALNNEDFEAAASHLDDDLHFIGVLGARDGSKDYLNDMRQLKMKYAIHRSFTDGQNVCIICDFQTAGVNLFGAGWYQFKKHKISFIRVVFDPRTLLEKQQGR